MRVSSIMIHCIMYHDTLYHARIEVSIIAFPDSVSCNQQPCYFAPRPSVRVFIWTLSSDSLSRVVTLSSYLVSLCRYFVVILGVLSHHLVLALILIFSLDFGFLSCHFVPILTIPVLILTFSSSSRITTGSFIKTLPSSSVSDKNEFES